MPWVELTDEEEDIIPLEAPAPVVAPTFETEPGGFFATPESERRNEGRGPNDLVTEEEPTPSRWQEVTEEPSTSNYRELHDVGIVTAYRPGGDASMGLNAGIEGADLDAHDTPILGRTTFEDYIAGRGDYVTVAMDKNSSWQGQFLSSPNFPGMVFQVRDNGGYGNNKTGENWIDIAYTDPQRAKSMLLRGVPFTPISSEQAQEISASRENITHTPQLQALYVPGGSFSKKEETGLPDPFMEFTARTARGVETAGREMFGGALSLVESAFGGERNVYLEEPEKAEGDIPLLEEQIATLQKQLKDQTLKDDPTATDWINETTLDSPELQKLDQQLKQARRAKAGDLQENILGQVSRQTERLATEAEQNQAAAMKKYQPFISASRDTKWGFQLADVLGTTVPGILASLGNPIFGGAVIYAQIYQGAKLQYMEQKPDATREEAQKFANDQALAQTPWAIAGNQLTARALKASFAALPAGAVERGSRIFGTQLGQAVAKNAQAFIGNVGSAIPMSMMSDMVSEDYDLLEDTTLGEKFARSMEPASLAAGVSAIFGAGGLTIAAMQQAKPVGPKAKPVTKAEPAPKEVPTKEIKLGPKALPAPAPKEAPPAKLATEGLTLYHGGDLPSIKKGGFRELEGGAGHYFTPDIEEARVFNEQLGIFEEPLAANVKLKNPLITRNPNESHFLKPERKAELIKQGYDGIILEKSDGSIQEVAAFHPKQITEVKPTGPVSVKRSAAARWDKMVERMRDEDLGQDILQSIIENDVSPQAVVQKFWNEAYPNLPDNAQKKFHGMIHRMTGFKPGDAYATQKNPDGTRTELTAKSWADLYPADNAPAKGKHLTGEDRGLVVLMELANQGLGQIKQAEVAPAPAALPPAKGSVSVKRSAEPKAAEEKALATRPPKYSPEEAALLKEEAAKAPPAGEPLALPPSKSIVGPVPVLAPGEIGPTIAPLFQIPRWRKKIQFTLGSMVSTVKDISPIRNYRRFWIGTAEVFENAPGGGLAGLGKAIRDYIDDGLRINARDTNPFRLWEKSVNAKEKAQAHDEFYRFFMQADDPDVNVQKLAIPTYWAATPKGRELIDLTRDYFNRSGIENQAEGVQVFDPKLNKWRPIGRIGSGDPIPPAWYPEWKAGYFPRMVSRDVMNTLRNPKDDPIAYKAVLDEMAARGFNPAQANDYISNILRASTSNDYFASLDLARTADLPTKMNDYTFESVRRYISARSNRLAQIRNFGQKTGPNVKDLFEQYHAIAGDDVTRTYINNIRNQILNVELVGPFRNSIRGLGTGLTGLHLGNWRTAMRNALSGQSMVATQYGIKRYAEGVINSFHNINDAYEKGIIIEDLFNLVGDGPNLGGRSMIQRGTDFLLKWSGEVPAENFNRVVNMGAAKALLRDAIAEYKNKGPTKKLLNYMGHFKRLGGIDPQALLDEGGAGPLTDRYLRQSVKRVQGGYQIDQVPAFLESDTGRFFLKYNKWGTQQTDMFVKEVIRPAIRSLTFGKYKKETVEVRNPETGKMETKQVPGDLSKAAAYFIILAGAGATAAQFDRHILGIEDMSVSLAEIIAKLNKDGQAAFFAILNKLWQYQLVMGIGGAIGNYAQWGIDWTERKRFKDPLTPPGLEFIKSTAQLAMDGWNQGGFTLADFDGYLRKNWSAYRTGKQLMAYLGNDVYPAGFRALQVESMRQDLSWMRAATRRFEKESRIEAPPGGPPGGMGKNPMTPFNRNLNEALLLGDVPEATRLVRERLRSAGRDYETVMDSIMDSVRARRPIKAGGSTSEAIAQNFMRWADDNMSAADAAKIRKIDKTYTHTAIAAGILKPGKGKTSEDIEESLRQMQTRTEMRQTR